uniref:Interferon alpha inducible protein 27 n=1 Tax=Aotus nancymaae TaxID=37293 RepID=A0A2K5CWW2_AOTNA
TGVARVAPGCAAALPVARVATVVIGTAVQAVPVVLGARGFTGAGMAENSIAAKMMSAAAIADGGGVASGSLVGTLQSLGATGLSRLTKLILGSTGSAVAARLVNFFQ